MPSTVEERIAALEAAGRRSERQLALWRGMACITTVVALSGSPLRSDGGGVTRAPFQVMGANGKAIFRVRETSIGNGMELLDKNGRSAIEFVVSPDRSGMSVEGGDGRKASVSATNSNVGVLLYGKDGVPQSALATDRSDGGSLVLTGANRKTFLLAGLDEKASPSITLIHPSKKSTLILRSTADVATISGYGAAPDPVFGLAARETTGAIFYKDMGKFRAVVGEPVAP